MNRKESVPEQMAYTNFRIGYSKNLRFFWFEKPIFSV